MSNGFLSHHRTNISAYHLISLANKLSHTQTVFVVFLCFSQRQKKPNLQLFCTLLPPACLMLECVQNINQSHTHTHTNTLSPQISLQCSRGPPAQLDPVAALFPHLANSEIQSNLCREGSLTQITLFPGEFYIKRAAQQTASCSCAELITFLKIQLSNTLNRFA